jgi:phosphate transport system permease protein
VTVDLASPDVLDQPMAIESRRATADLVYRHVVRAAGATTLFLMAAIGLFLGARALPAFRHAGFSFFTETKWAPTPTGGTFGIAALLLGTALIAVTAIAFAVPVAIATSLFVTEYCPRGLRRPLISVIDLLAAIPSLIYGIWGATVLQGKVVHVSKFLHDHFGWFPPFRVDGVEIPGVQSSAPTLGDYAASTFLAGIVVALMILPLCTAVTREVFSQAPSGEKEGALALGGTRWGVIREVVLPFGRGGIIGGAMLGLGRALGETVAVALIINPRTDVGDLLQILKSAGNSIAALIANNWAEGLEGMTLNAMMAAGLVLFAVTLAVNAVASAVVVRSRSGASTEI